MFFSVFSLGIAGIVVLIMLTTQRDSQSGGKQPGSNTAYDYGYWEGRRSLRREVIELIEGKDSVESRQIQAVIDANQWYPEGSGQVDQSTQVRSGLAHSAAPVAQQQAVAPPQPVDYSAGLLYLGAFLFITAASLFVLLSGVGGGVKTLVVIAVSLLFYAAGLFLTQKSQRLAGVGSAFAAIGLMLAPLAGVAVYGYWLSQTHGGLTWLVTSIACLALYTHALFTLRKDYVGYLCIAMLISLVESATFQIGLGMYYLAWGLILVGIISIALQQLLRRSSGEELPSKQLALPLILTSTVIVPVALFWSLVLILNHGVGQFIFSLFFVGTYYAMYGYLQRAGVARQAYWIIAQCTALLGGALFVYHVTQAHAALSVYLAACAVVYFVGSLDRQLKQIYPRHHMGVFALSTLLTLVATVSVAVWAQWLLLALLVSLAAFWAQWRVHRQVDSAILAVVALLITPAVFGWYVLSPVLGAGWMAALYTVLAYCLMAVAYYVRRLTTGLQPVLVTGYVSSIAFAFGVACFAGYSTAALVLVCAGLLAYGAARSHRLPELSYIGHAFLYIALAIASFNYQDIQIAVLLCGWLLLSAAVYALSFVSLQDRWVLAARVSSAAGLLLTAYLSLVEADYWYLSPLSLVLLAFICGYESHRRGLYWLRELAAALVLVAVQIVFYQLDLRELLVYSHMWALLFLTLAVARYAREEGKASQDYIWASLSAATIPFALLLLGGGVGVNYGWLFIAQHICIVMAGVLLRRSNVLWWGLIATILAVLYELRDLQFIALGVLSVFVLGVAIWSALRHQGGTNINGQ